MSRFLLFSSSSDYDYPAGWETFTSAHVTLDEAKAAPNSIVRYVDSGFPGQWLDERKVFYTSMTARGDGLPGWAAMPPPDAPPCPSPNHFWRPGREPMTASRGWAHIVDVEQLAIVAEHDGEQWSDPL